MVGRFAAAGFRADFFLAMKRALRTAPTCLPIEGSFKSVSTLRAEECEPWQVALQRAHQAAVWAAVAGVAVSMNERSRPVIANRSPIVAAYLVGAATGSAKSVLRAAVVMATTAGCLIRFSTEMA